MWMILAAIVIAGLLAAEYWLDELAAALASRWQANGEDQSSTPINRRMPWETR